MDVLSEILDKVDLLAATWYRTHLREIWASASRRKRILARFHIVTHGEFWYEVQKLKNFKALAGARRYLIYSKGWSTPWPVHQNQGRAWWSNLEPKPTSPKLKFWNTVIEQAQSQRRLRTFLFLMADLIIHSKFAAKCRAYQEYR